MNLEDISAPRCFEVEARLRAALDIPVFHDDQHGTAIVVVAALTNALKVVGKQLGDVRITMAGAGAAGTAVLKLLLAAGAGAGAGEVVVCDEHGALHAGRTDLHDSLAWTVEHTNARGFAGSLKEAVVGADVFIGVSAPNILDGDDVAAMAERSIVFALANPTPEVDPALAAQHAAVVATGRSDVANQINNVLVFPGVFRGLLDARSKDVTEETMLAAALALAGVVDDDELNAAYIVPSVFHPDVAAVVAQAVAAAVQGADPGEAAEAAVDSAGAGAGQGQPALEAPRVAVRRASSSTLAVAVVAAVVHVVVLYSPRAPSVGSGLRLDLPVHVAVFAAVALTARWAGVGAAAVAVVLAVEALVSEAVQALWLPGRTGDVTDLVADAVGIAAGLWGWAVLARRARLASAASPAPRP